MSDLTQDEIQQIDDFTMSNTDRGFGILNFTDNNGEQCSLQKSSSAMTDKVWLGISDPKPMILHGDAKKLGIATEATCGHVEYPLPKEVFLSGRMHLDREQAKVLAEQLSYFANTGNLQAIEEHKNENA